MRPWSCTMRGCSLRRTTLPGLPWHAAVSVTALEASRSHAFGCCVLPSASDTGYWVAVHQALAAPPPPPPLSLSHTLPGYIGAYLMQDATLMPGHAW